MIRFRICWNVLFMTLFVTSNAQEEFTRQRQERELYKGYSGLHLFNNSLQMVYFHDLTIAVVEIAKGRVLMNCELIEVFHDEQRSDALRNLTKQVGPPFELRLNEMMELMSQCDSLDYNVINKRISAVLHRPQISSLDAPENTQSSILSGIVPGTKWCGTGDIAKNYFDMGPEMTMDRCCRAHDLCPVKVRGYGARYNLTNKSLYTKSHCSCDDELSKCLKSSEKSAANFMGNIYFNILRIPCIVDDKEGKKKFRSAKPY